jgi:glyoxylase-like metal-dependent hydrolase (beta-lactamase superfamily II)
MRDQTRSRRDFLRAAGAFGTAAAVSGSLPADWLLAQTQAPTLEAMRTQLGAIPIQKTPLAQGLTMFSGPGGNVVVLQSAIGKIVVDGFVKPAWPKLKAELDALDGSPIKSLVDTHWHLDHSDNNGNFRAAGASVIAHENTRTRLMQPHDLAGMHIDPVASADMPAQTFAAGLTLNARVEQIGLTHVAPAHTDTDVLVHFPKSNVLHMGDVYFSGSYPFIDAGTGGHINGMIDGVQTALKSVDAQTKIVPGHGPPGNRTTLEAYGHMLMTVRDKVRALKSSGKSLADVQAAKPSAAFDDAWGKGRMTPNDFIALVYNTLR